MSCKIVVVGSSNTDMIVKTGRIPGPGETVIGGAFCSAAGGKGANQAVAAARAGGEVTFVARVGDDVFGREALDKLGINGPVAKTPNAATRLHERRQRVHTGPLIRPGQRQHVLR